VKVIELDRRITDRLEHDPDSNPEIEGFLERIRDLSGSLLVKAICLSVRELISSDLLMLREKWRIRCPFLSPSLSFREIK
jgi:hypothetical protein